MALVERCAQCGFVFAELDPPDIPASLRHGAEVLRHALERADAAGTARRRPRPGVWSPLEYTCHVRDVLFIQRDRVLLALVEDVPGFAPMYRDERVALAGYDDEDTGEVADELVMGASMLGKLFARLSPPQLSRRCLYNYPETAERDLTWLGRQTVHETVHHRGDVAWALAADPTGTP